MIEPDRTEWQVRCAFNAFCKQVLKNEAINIYNETQQRQAQEMTSSNLPQEENQLFILDKQYEGEEGQSFQVAGKNITPKLLAEALRTLPKEKRKTVLLYYFFNTATFKANCGNICTTPRIRSNIFGSPKRILATSRFFINKSCIRISRTFKESRSKSAKPILTRRSKNYWRQTAFSMRACIKRGFWQNGFEGTAVFFDRIRSTLRFGSMR